MKEFNKLRVYHINQRNTGGNGGGNGDGVVYASDFGDWLDLPSKSNQIFDEQILIQYKLDMMSYPDKAILYLVGQFGLNPNFEGSEIILGVLPLNTRPKHQLKMDFTAKSTEIYLVIELNGEVKLQTVSGDLPVTLGGSEPDPYFLNLDYNPQIEDEPSTYTAVRSQNFTRNNCGEGYTGTTVNFQKTYTSNISQADADNQRANDANFVADGQAWANDPLNGATCEVAQMFYATRTESFTRNNCAPGSTGSAVNYSKIYSSGISQADADNKAATDDNYQSLGQAYANDPLNGATCEVAQMFYATRTESFTRNNCAPGSTGSAVNYSKIYSSGISQADADSQADNDEDFASEGQAYANDPDNGATCTVVSPIVNGTAKLYATREQNPQPGTALWSVKIQIDLNNVQETDTVINGIIHYSAIVDGSSSNGSVNPGFSLTIPMGSAAGTDLTGTITKAYNAGMGLPSISDLDIDGHLVNGQTSALIVTFEGEDMGGLE